MKKFLNDHLLVKEEVEEKKAVFQTGREVEWKKAVVVDANNKDLIEKTVIYHPTTRILKDRKENTFYIMEKSIYEILD